MLLHWSIGAADTMPLEVVDIISLGSWSESENPKRKRYRLVGE
jgi:hypothetical protein